MTPKPLTIALSLALLGISLQARAMDDRWYIAPMLSHINPDNKLGAEESMGLGFGLGQAVSEHWNMEILARGNKLDNDLGGSNLRQRGLGIDGLYFFNRNPAFAPYAVMGLGGLRTTLPGGVDSGLNANVGLGFMTQLGNDMALRADARRRWTDSDITGVGTSLNDWLVNVGLQIPLGPKPIVLASTPSAAPTEPSPAAPVAVMAAQPAEPAAATTKPSPAEEPAAATTAVSAAASAMPPEATGASTPAAAATAASEPAPAVPATPVAAAQPSAPLSEPAPAAAPPTPAVEPVTPAPMTAAAPSPAPALPDPAPAATDPAAAQPAAPAPVLAATPEPAAAVSPPVIEPPAPATPASTDSDNDGVADALDNCPATPAGRSVNPLGCEIDSDGDGVVDALDKCPATPTGGKVNADGCLPDADGDGVIDSLDNCPATPAGRSVNPLGCEIDSDSDGVVDALDKCLGTLAGRTVNADGCELDADGDGIVDALDQCAATPAGDKVDEKGCTLASAITLKGVHFDSDSAKLRPESQAVLDKTADILMRYPHIDVEVAGHTDSTYTDAYNKRLSEDRAKSVCDYFIQKGIEARRLRAKGYGETSPVADNKSKAGREQNRRVELHLAPE
jgi:outer membrane protein OmpA-like peptidoglycan-associated protein